MKTTHKMAEMSKDESKKYYRERAIESYRNDKLSKIKVNVRQYKFRNKHNPKVQEVACCKDIDPATKLHLIKKILLQEKLEKMNI